MCVDSGKVSGHRAAASPMGAVSPRVCALGSAVVRFASLLSCASPRIEVIAAGASLARRANESTFITSQ